MATYHPQGIEGNNGLDVNFIPFTSSVNPATAISPTPYPVSPSNSMNLGPLGNGVLVPADENTINKLNPLVSAPALNTNFPALTLAF
jgi:hypothetical protein